MSSSSRFDLSGRNFTLIHCSESFVESCQTLRVALPSGLIILLTVLPFPKVIQSSRQQEVRVNVINETENDLLLVVNFGRSKRPNMVPPAPFCPTIVIKLSTRLYNYVLYIKQCWQCVDKYQTIVFLDIFSDSRLLCASKCCKQTFSARLFGTLLLCARTSTQ